MHFLDDFVISQSLIFVGTLVFILLVIAEFAGRNVRNILQKRAGNKNVEATGIDYITTSVFALLGLLIAFTFGLALDRYESRRDLVMLEANSIGTAHIRAEFAPQPIQTELKTLLEDYAANRLEYGYASFARKREVAKISSNMRSELAILGVSASQNAVTPSLAPLLIISINDVIDVGSEREAINLARVPESVIHMLLGYAIISAFVLGYSQADSVLTQRIANRMLFGLLTLALVTIFDLDRPATGVIKVSQLPMLELVNEFRK